MAEHHELGRQGESFVLAYLEKEGFDILERNFRFKKAEVDIIARKENLLLAVEVKCRSTEFFGEPYEFVKPAQQKLIREAIHHYVETRQLEVEVRFDVASVVPKNGQMEMDYLPDAFFMF